MCCSDRSRVRSPAVKVLALGSSPEDSNPYGRLFDEAVTALGVRLVELPSPDAREMTAKLGLIDVVHLQWLEPYLAATGAGLERVARVHVRLARLAAALARIRRSRVRLVWTIHNVRPHERPLPWTDRLLTAALLRAADGLLVHSHYAARRVLSELHPRCPIWVAPHGNYIESYPRTSLTREEARARLGIDAEPPTFLCFGQVREYKRIPDVIRAFRSRRRDATLLVVGRPLDADLAAEVGAAAGEDPRVRLVLDSVPSEEVELYHRAADAAVLNYREVFSSGALMLALSQGLPVIAPEDSSAGELLAPGAGVLLGPTDQLADALVRFVPSEAMRAAALANARAYPWTRTAEAAVGAYTGRDPDYPARRG